MPSSRISTQPYNLNLLTYAWGSTVKRRQHGHVPFPFLVSYSLTDFLRIMVKGGGEERREGVRGRRGREEEDELCKNEQSLANSNVLTYPPSPPQYRCLMGFSPVGYVQDPVKTPVPHIPLMETSQAI